VLRFGRFVEDLRRVERSVERSVERYVERREVTPDKQFDLELPEVPNTTSEKG
jgi:hypothetical protein